MTRRDALGALAFAALPSACSYFRKARMRDVHSFAEPDKVRVRHVALDLSVSFENRSIGGVAELTLDRTDRSAPLMLDTRDLDVGYVQESANGKAYTAGRFT